MTHKLSLKRRPLKLMLYILMLYDVTLPNVIALCFIANNFNRFEPYLLLNVSESAIKLSLLTTHIFRSYIQLNTSYTQMLIARTKEYLTIV